MGIRLCAAVLTTALAAVASLPAAARAHPAEPCNGPRSVTVEATAGVRIFLRPRVPRDRRTVDTNTFGCLYRTGKRIRLGRRGDGVLFGFHVERRRVAFVSTGYASRGHTVHVVDLGTGRRLARIRNPNAAVTDLEVTRYGSLAWIGRPFHQDLGGWVRAWEPGRGERLLDAGAIAPHGLALGRATPAAGTTLYWDKDGLPRSATLDG
jgi:hypothetical protein